MTSRGVVGRCGKGSMPIRDVSTHICNVSPECPGADCGVACNAPPWGPPSSSASWW